MIQRLIWPAIVAAIVLFATQALAEKRVALVIGNADYSNAATLPNPRNDASDVTAALKHLGFVTVTGTDLDKAGMDKAAIEFARAARDADVALFYYSGHAMQFGGVNYLMPVDAKLTDEADLRLMMRADDVVADLQQAKSLRILVLDSCRDNPLAERLLRSLGAARAAGVPRGLAKMDTPQGMIVAYATQAGHTADDGAARNSPYTGAFLRNIEAADEIGAVFRRISADVYDATGHSQLPELSLSLIGEFYLNGRRTDPAPADIAQLKDQIEAIQKQLKTRPSLPASEPNAASSEPRRDDTIHNDVALATPPRPQGSAVSCAGAATVSVVASRPPQPLSSAEECSVRTKDVFRECDRCPDMVVVPAGQFAMGSPNTEPDRNSDEGPQTRISIDRPFAVGRFEVTLGEYKAFVEASGYNVARGCQWWSSRVNGWDRRTAATFLTPGFPQDDNHPVVCVDWTDAKAYVDWLRSKTGKPYRLLTEQEWEYAARAGTTTPFWWGSEISSAQANYDGRTAYGAGRKGTWRQATMRVDSFEPNPWGLYNVHGNVWEWIEDCYQYEQGYGNAAQAPKSVAERWGSTCGPDARGMRGGSWVDDPDYLRSARRVWHRPRGRLNYLGLRVARTVGY
jgi:formylglycine-generating enzyme required for sulfatase activity